MTQHVTAATRAATRFLIAPPAAAPRRFHRPALARMAPGAMAAVVVATMSMACVPASAQALAGAAFAGFAAPGFALAGVDAPLPGGDGHGERTGGPDDAVAATAAQRHGAAVPSRGGVQGGRAGAGAPPVPGSVDEADGPSVASR